MRRKKVTCRDAGKGCEVVCHGLLRQNHHIEQGLQVLSHDRDAGKLVTARDAKHHLAVESKNLALSLSAAAAAAAAAVASYTMMMLLLLLMMMMMMMMMLVLVMDSGQVHLGGREALEALALHRHGNAAQAQPLRLSLGLPGAGA